MEALNKPNHYNKPQSRTFAHCPRCMELYLSEELTYKNGVFLCVYCIFEEE